MRLFPLIYLPAFLLYCGARMASIPSKAYGVGVTVERVEEDAGVGKEKEKKAEYRHDKMEKSNILVKGARKMRSIEGETRSMDTMHSESVQEQKKRSVWRAVGGDACLSILCHRISCSHMLLFLALSCASLCTCSYLSYYFYGMDYVESAILYHITRKDHRHNFSVYFLPMHLLAGDASVN